MKRQLFIICLLTCGCAGDHFSSLYTSAKDGSTSASVRDFDSSAEGFVKDANVSNDVFDSTLDVPDVAVDVYDAGFSDTIVDVKNSLADAGFDADATMRDAVADVDIKYSDVSRDIEHDSPPGCPNYLPGPSLVEISAPNGTKYCIDSTEVTNAHYAEFLSEANINEQPSECAWNDTYIPLWGWPAENKDDYPVVEVDWCDAHAYCEWAGKRLCGRVGGGILLYGDFADATKSEWMNACSDGGVKAYPYGNSYDGRACVGEDYDGVSGYQENQDVLRPVASAPGCEGAFPGIFDISGNAWEWDAACNGTTGELDYCRRRGGAFYTFASNLRCDTEVIAGLTRNFQANSLSFRCCASME